VGIWTCAKGWTIYMTAVRLGNNHIEIIGEYFIIYENVSTYGLILPLPYIESERVEHKAGKRVVAREKERGSGYMRERVYACVRMRAAGIIFGLKHTKFSSRLYLAYRMARRMTSSQSDSRSAIKSFDDRSRLRVIRMHRHRCIKCDGKR